MGENIGLVAIICLTVLLSGIIIPILVNWLFDKWRDK